jgi:hypothetical protein
VWSERIQQYPICGMQDVGDKVGKGRKGMVAGVRSGQSRSCLELSGVSPKSRQESPGVET